MGRNRRQLLTGTYPAGFTITTVQAPHSPSAQPSLAPVNPRERTKSRSVACVEAFLMLTGLPFSRNSICIGGSPWVLLKLYSIQGDQDAAVRTNTSRTERVWRNMSRSAGSLILAA